MGYKEIIYALGFDSDKLVGTMTVSDVKKRLTGNFCDCKGNGRFELLPLCDPMVQANQVRYAQCRACGSYTKI